MTAGLRRDARRHVGYWLCTVPADPARVRSGCGRSRGTPAS